MGVEVNAMLRSFLLVAVSVAAVAASPCCSTCGGDTVKYWALDTPNNECAETCLNPSDKLRIAEFGVLTGFKGKQAGVGGACSTHGFHSYNRTDNIGVGPIEIQLDKYLPDAGSTLTQSEGRYADFVVADMHDGDKKRITFGPDGTGVLAGTFPMTIRPHGNNQTWIVHVTMVMSKGSPFNTGVQGVVDFNVPGKPNPPPCNLTVALWTESTPYNLGPPAPGPKRALEFTDHTGVISHDPALPLNTWVEIPAAP